MPGRFLTQAERERLQRFPEEISPQDMITYFALSARDMAKVRQQRSAHNRLGFALQLCALRYLGFSPDDVTTAPTNVVSYVAEQLKVSAESLTAYGNRPHTRRDHLQEIMLHIRFHRATPTDLERLGKWLGERALEHDKPTLLFQLACEKLLRERIVRPGVTSLERLVVTARQEAQKEIFQRLVPLLTDEHKALLDHLLVPNDNMGLPTRQRPFLPALKNSLS
jgi:hypothetical protein